MALFDRFRKTEHRNLENPNAPVSAVDFLQIMGWGDLYASSGVTVNVDTALSVPAIWAAVNFIAGTIAGLPLQVYQKQPDGGRKKSDGLLSRILHDSINEDMSSFEWRKYSFEQVLTGGRSITYIEKEASRSNQSSC